MTCAACGFLHSAPRIAIQCFQRGGLDTAKTGTKATKKATPKAVLKTTPVKLPKTGVYNKANK